MLLQSLAKYIRKVFTTFIVGNSTKPESLARFCVLTHLIIRCGADAIPFPGVPP